MQINQNDEIVIFAGYIILKCYLLIKKEKKKWNEIEKRNKREDEICSNVTYK